MTYVTLLEEEVLVESKEEKPDWAIFRVIIYKNGLMVKNQQIWTSTGDIEIVCQNLKKLKC